MKAEIELTQKPYAQSGMYRIPTAEGQPSDEALTGKWWQANAEDGSGIEFTVIWNSDGEEADVDWKNPDFIIARGDISLDITGKAELKENEFLSF
ncbi:MAG: hypothetical protein Q4C56_09720 [Peptococcaceae bacterium]|nr:hypothetical protein [Peptococcaceae bacterium]